MTHIRTFFGTRLLIGLLGVAALTGCTTTGAGSGAQLLSSRALLNELDGGLIGRIEGLDLRNADRTIALQAEYRALENTAPSEPVYWQSANQAISGTVVPSQPFRVGTQDCRQYTVLVTTQDGTNEERGSACRNEDGSWNLLS